MGRPSACRGSRPGFEEWGRRARKKFSHIPRCVYIIAAPAAADADGGSEFHQFHQGCRQHFLEVVASGPIY